MSDAVLKPSTQYATRSRFYVWMSGVCLAIAILGFMPSYFVPMVTGGFIGLPLMHIHGLILYSWMILFFAQTWLVATGRTPSHRTWGMLGISIVTAMVFMTLTLSASQIAMASLPGQPHGLARAMRTFKWVSVGGMIFVAATFALAIVNIRKPDVHKRLILLMTISMLGAPIARWFIFFFAPASDAALHINDPLPYLEVPPIFVAIPPMIVSDILLFIAIFHDWRTIGRVHPVYLIGGGVLLLYQVTLVPAANSGAWQAAATWLGSLAG